jgi:hypothetical protein
MKSVMITLGALLYASCAFAQAGPGDRPPLADSNSGLLAKMTSSMTATASKPGDVVTAEVIDPVPLRGAHMEGNIERADHSVLQFSFHTMRLGGRSYPIESRLQAIASSKGNEGQDDLNQRVRIDGGSIIAYGVTTALEEGAELRLSVWKKQ